MRTALPQQMAVVPPVPMPFTSTISGVLRICIVGKGK